MSKLADFDECGGMSVEDNADAQYSYLMLLTSFAVGTSRAVPDNLRVARRDPEFAIRQSEALRESSLHSELSRKCTFDA
jgi:hypothetical protein